jgi:hypothetical protein
MNEEMKREERAVVKWTNVKNKCSSNNLAFNLTVEDVKNFLSVGKCEMTGRKLILSNKAGDDIPQNSLTFDRIVPRLGYTRGNIAVVSKRINTSKSDLTLLEIIQLSKYIKKHLGMERKSDTAVIKSIKEQLRADGITI